MNAAFWHGKRVLVTGHIGFKGNWLVLCGCATLGAEVAGLALPPATTPICSNWRGYANDPHSVFADIRDLEAVEIRLS